ncbi:MAG TPA: carboxypeptidase regulatory-like domain-containing protein [Patescibacteria group bacterium]|nr:carboxypeptidase regulatory-like domain-containing protein [Patescibacteria group bacterium]
MTICQNFRITKPYCLMITAIAAIAAILIFADSIPPTLASQTIIKNPRFWEVQSIDTMKYSRDLSREKLKDPSFDVVIDKQVKAIAETGATHVAISTPYDEEFLPILKRWASAARNYNLKIWFRGNWSGWEKWFDYKSISREEHIKKTKEFIIANKDLFEDGDIFSACPECENGGPGDPRRSGDAEGFKSFLISEYAATKKAFVEIGRSVASNYHPMNGDMARLIMDKETTTALGGIVAIDHYVKDPEKLIQDIKDLHRQSGGKVVLAEFGAPIPDIHGKISDADQAKWLESLLEKSIELPELIGLNYWVNVGGTTELWSKDGEAKPAVSILTKFYNPEILSGTIRNELGKPIAGAAVLFHSKKAQTDEAGVFQFPKISSQYESLNISADGYIDQTIKTEKWNNGNIVILIKNMPTFWFRILRFFHNLFGR